MVDVSFVTSCYNAERFLDGLIENLREQSHADWELIVVDSASTDNSVDIVKRWRDTIDGRIQLIEQPERTPYGVSWLTGWQQARGKIVTNSNADDRSYPWRGTQVLQAREDAQHMDGVLRWEKCHFYYGGYETRVNGRVTAKGVPPRWDPGDLQRFFRCGVHVHWDNTLRDLADWEKMFGAAAEYRSAFDYWLVLYFTSLGATGVAIPSCFSIYNQRADSIEQADKERNTFESMRAISTFYPGGPVVQDLENKTRIESPEFYQRYQAFLAGFGE
jgi:glycosyltransferase involved in cell wall biosynthesis